MVGVNLTKWRILQPGCEEYSAVAAEFGVRIQHIAVNLKNPSRRQVLPLRYRVFDDSGLKETRVTDGLAGCLDQT